jgi:hypothetical protein
VSFENTTLKRGVAGLENSEAKGHPFESINAGQTKNLLEVQARGSIRRIWMTVSDRSPEMLRALRLQMWWDHAKHPAISCPLGDFFGIGLGRRSPFENALFSDPKGRSFNCFVPMPFRSAAKVTLTNESSTDLSHLFYDIDLLEEPITENALYFHAHSRSDSPNALGSEYKILPKVKGAGRFLGSNIGVATDPRYEGTWWGEGEVKIRFGNDDHPTLCGTGTEDYIGTGWGQGPYCHRTQGCLIADPEHRQYCFYRFHLDDPVYFDEACVVSIQTIGGGPTAKVLELMDAGAPAIPVSVDAGSSGGLLPLLNGNPVDLRSAVLQEKWCNFWRQDHWSSTAYFYLDAAEGQVLD